MDRAGALASQLRSLQVDIEEKERRIESIKEEIKAGSFEQRLGDMHAKSRNMESRRDELTAEIRTLSLQADARARLDLKRTEVKSKTAEMQNTYAVSCVFTGAGADWVVGSRCATLGSASSLIGMRRLIPWSGT